jgi:hypothetical protein
VIFTLGYIKDFILNLYLILLISVFTFDVMFVRLIGGRVLLAGEKYCWLVVGDWFVLREKY